MAFQPQVANQFDANHCYGLNPNLQLKIGLLEGFFFFFFLKFKFPGCMPPAGGGGVGVG